jgi:mono/diheme cytochrome c family protein
MKYKVVGMTSALIAILVLPRVALAEGNDVAEGKRYFLSYCASCHGVNGDGHGPVAPALSTSPANLRLLGEKYGTPLPAARLANLIDGRSAIRAHGSREMPVWGEKLYQLGQGERGDTGVSEVIGKIVAYLNTIQDRRTATR